MRVFNGASITADHFRLNRTMTGSECNHPTRVFIAYISRKTQMIRNVKAAAYVRLPRVTSVNENVNKIPCKKYSSKCFQYIVNFSHHMYGVTNLHSLVFRMKAAMDFAVVMYCGVTRVNSSYFLLANVAMTS